MKKENKQNSKIVNKGFTLIEMLVVVLIIGILAAIALPQYKKAVEKAKLSEVLINLKAIEDSVDRYLLVNGFPNEDTYFKDFGDIELSGGEWNGNAYETTNNDYSIGNWCTKYGCELVAVNKYDDYSSAIIEVYWDHEEKTKRCYTNMTNKGHFICEYLKSFNWEYEDDAW